MEEARVCGFNIILDSNGNLVTEEATIKEEDIDNLKMKETEKEIIKAVLKAFKRAVVGMHSEVENELRTTTNIH